MHDDDDEISADLLSSSKAATGIDQGAEPPLVVSYEFR